MYYEINIALYGQHFFATHERSIKNYVELCRVFSKLKESFKKSDGFEITITKYIKSGEQINIDTIEEYDGN